MKQMKQFWQDNSRIVAYIVLALLLLSILLLYRLGSLIHGLSSGELQTATNVVGWHGIYYSPLDLPLKIVRSVVFYIDPNHGQTLTRLPNAIFGGLTIISFSCLTWLWHGRRTAIFASVLFGTSAWVLHVSRLASFDVMYLWSITTLLLTHTLINRFQKYSIVWFGILAIWALMITIPGMIWFITAELFLQRASIKKFWFIYSRWWQRGLSIILPLLTLPLIIINFTRSGQIIAWLGLPSHIAGPLSLLKQFIGVFVHLFIRGPQYPTLWLGRTTLLDAFSLTMCVLGIYFYATRWHSTRSRLLEIFFIIGVILVALQGSVSLSVLVPLMYAASAMGIAYMLHEWFKVFPLNPLARSVGIGLITITVAISCVYNIRSYFIAWPHNEVTKVTFRYHR